MKGSEKMENKSNFTATEAKNLLWEHIKMLSEEAKIACVAFTNLELLKVIHS